MPATSIKSADSQVNEYEANWNRAPDNAGPERAPADTNRVTMLNALARCFDPTLSPRMAMPAIHMNDPANVWISRPMKSPVTMIASH